MEKLDGLFKPFTVKGMPLTNRIVMAPMTRYFCPDGKPGDDVAAYYQRRAENGCGLIITEGTWIDCPVASGYPNVPAFHGDALPAWRRVAEAVHGAGGRIIPQLWHVGGQRDPATSDNPALTPLSPSGIDVTLSARWQPMSREQIHGIVDAFARGARDAQAAGFDGVEVHGAHGYLLDQFLWHKTNRRSDEYGGSIENRVRFAVEIIAAMRAAVGPDFPILLRLSQWKAHDYAAKFAATPQELERFLTPLVAAGVDLFDCSQRRFWEPEFEGSNLNLAGWVKKLSGKPTITVGSVGLAGDFLGTVTNGEDSSTRDIGDLLERLEREEFDLVAVGRALLGDPAWIGKVRAGRFEALQPFSAESLGVLY